MKPEAAKNWGRAVLSILCAAALWPGLEIRTSAAGTLLAWGDNSVNQTALPPDPTNFVAIAAGAFHNLALRTDSTVAAWGQNSLGETTVPPGLSNVTAVAAAWGSSVALKTDGTIAAWGWNVVSQTTFPTNITNAIAITAGWDHAILLKEDGTVVSWGNNPRGQTNTPAGLTNVIAIAGGGWHSLALRRDGTVAMWGDNTVGQRVMPPSLTNIVAIAGGGFHSLALRKNGTVVAWGTNDFGQLNVPLGLSNVVAIAAGQYHSLAVKRDGTVVGWGRNVSGQASIPPDASDVGAISAGIAHTLAMKGAKVKILRVLVAQANPGDTIVLEPTTYYDNVVIDKNLSLRGAGIGQTIIDANYADSAIVIGTNTTVDVRDVTVVNAMLQRVIRREFPGTTFFVRGPGILNLGLLSITDCEIRDCPGDGVENLGVLDMRRCRITSCGPEPYFYGAAPEFAGSPTFGGGIENQGVGRVVDCTITRGTSIAGGGGGIANEGTLAMTNCAVDGFAHVSVNLSGGSGGGIANSGQLTLDRCLVNGGARWYGASISSSSNLLALNSTFMGQASYSAGILLTGVGTSEFSACEMRGTGIENGGPVNASIVTTTHSLALVNCTVTLAQSPDRGGILTYGPTQLSHCTVVSNKFGVRGNFTAKNCIIAGNDHYDVSGTLSSEGYNLIQNTNGMTLVGSPIGNIYGADPLLGPLQDNGAPTLTHALLPGSPAIDAGSSQGISTDQRGYFRPWDISGIANRDDGSDIGAYEYVVAPGTLYVDANNPTPVPPYATWQTAATRIQPAINLAGNGARIRVRAGTYPERIDYLGRALTIASESGPGVTTIDAGESGSAVRIVGIESATSILDGFRIINGYASNGGGIYCSNASPVITNCIVANNRTIPGNDGVNCETGSSVPGNGGDGGGIYASENSHPFILSCVISNNHTGPGGFGFPHSPPCPQGPTGHGGNGGGIACHTATIVQCMVVSNRTGWGGFSIGQSAGHGGNGGGTFCRDATMVDCLFVGNVAGGGGEAAKGHSGYGGNGGSGGGIACLSSPIIERCVFIGNRTLSGGGFEYVSGDGGNGGAIAALGGSPEIRSSHFEWNTTGSGAYSMDRAGNGGSGGALYAAVSCYISNCQFRTNITGDGGSAGSAYPITLGGRSGSGGAIYIQSGKVTGCLIQGNRTGKGGHTVDPNDPGIAGDAGDGAGIFANDAIILSCLVVNNATGQGGDARHPSIAGRGGNGSGCWATDSSIINCTFWGNDLGPGGLAVTNTSGMIGVPGTVGIGGGLWCTNSSIINCIVWNNTGREIAGGNFTVTSSDIEDGASEPWFNPTNSLNADPQFIDPALGNWRLQPSSPCIDVGTNMTWMITAQDLDGNARLVNGRPDLGAYESPAGPQSLSATHQAGLYTSPGTATIQCQFRYPAGRQLLSLLWRPILPAGWNLSSVSGDGSPVLAFGEILVSGSISSNPLNLTYVVAVPAGQTGIKQIGGLVQYQLDGMINSAEFAPTPVSLPIAPVHTSDYRTPRGQIDGTEANRVLAYWRAQAYHSAPTGLDGFAPGVGDHIEPRHMADYRSAFWVIDATEVNRVLSYWRAGCYQANAEGLDGYAPGCEEAGIAITPASSAVGAAADLSATHVGPQVYRPGGVVTVTNRLSYSGTLLSLLARPILPAGWTLLNVAGDGAPEIVAGEIILASTTLPASPVQFVYTVTVPANARGVRQVRTELEGHIRGQPNPQANTSIPEWLPIYWQPPLTVTRRDLTLVLSWPAGDDQFVAEFSSSLTPPVDWRPVISTIQNADGQISVAIEPSGLTQFYRLRRMP